MPQAELAIIGGSGFYQMEGLTDRQEIRCRDSLRRPQRRDSPGHARRHRASLSSPATASATVCCPARYRAGPISTLSRLSASSALSRSTPWAASARRSRPATWPCPQQLIDQTKGHANSFFGRGLVAHISFAEPFCPTMRELLRPVRPPSGGDGARGRHLRRHGRARSSRRRRSRSSTALEAPTSSA